MKFKHKRRTVEIYFILYLAALIFLLPKRDEEFSQTEEKYDAGAFQLPFTLQPEKTSLTGRIIIDSTGPQILSLDSVNTIFYTGSVKDVNFEFYIEDQSLNQSLQLTSDKKPSTKYFSIEERTDRQAAMFYWSPPLFERTNKTYIVRVIATAKPKYFGSDKNEPEQTLKVKTQFSLNVIYIYTQGTSPGFGPNDLLAGNYNFDSSFINQFNEQPINSQTPTNRGEVELIISDYDIKGIVMQNWENTIFADNFSFIRDLTSKPVINVTHEPPNNGGSAYLYDLKEDKILIRGKTPNFGIMKVEVSVDVKPADKKLVETFKVRPTPLNQPSYAKRMYPDITYTIDPRLPLIGKETKAMLKEGNNIRAQSNQGEKFQFTPSITDTGKIFTLERLVDGTLLGEKYIIQVIDYPVPDIIDIQTKGNKQVEVITRAFGYYNRQRNEVKSFKVSGNATYQDLRGKIKDIDDGKMIRIQHFLFTPLDNDKPFNFTIRAVDLRGESSLAKGFAE